MALTALTTIMMIMVLFPGVMADSGRDSPVEVLVIGNTIPDASFFFYDPSLSYRVLAYPSWAESWTSEETDR